MLSKIIVTLVALFAVLGLFLSGSNVANGLINAEDGMLVVLGFGVYLAVGIAEILLGYGLYKMWSK